MKEGEPREWKRENKRKKNAQINENSVKWNAFAVFSTRLASEKSGQLWLANVYYAASAYTELCRTPCSVSITICPSRSPVMGIGSTLCN